MLRRIFEKLIVLYRMMILCMRTQHFYLKKEWTSFARFLEIEYFSKLLQKNIESVEFLVRDEGLKLESHESQTIDFPISSGIARLLLEMGIKTLRLNTRLESNQISDVFNVFCQIDTDIQRIKKGRTAIYKDLLDQLISDNGLKRFCAEIKLKENLSLLDVKYSYCQLSFSKLVDRLKNFGKLFKDHRWFFYAAPRYSLVVILCIFFIPKILRTLFPAVGEIALILTSILLGIMTYILFQTIGSIEYDKEEQASQIRRINRELQERDRIIRQDLEIATRIQEHLLPRKEMDVGLFKIAAGLKPQAEVGGDIFDVRRRENGDTEIILVDSVGHGLSASLVTVAIKAIFSQSNKQGVELVRALNDALKEILPDGFFAALTYLCIMPKSREITFLNAGNPYPFVIKKEGAVDIIKDYNITPLGILSLNPDLSGKIELERGESLVLFTDGIAECQNSDGVEFGEKSLKDVLLQNTSLQANELRDHLFSESSRYAHGAPQKDDQTVLIIRAQ